MLLLLIHVSHIFKARLYFNFKGSARALNSPMSSYGNRWKSTEICFKSPRNKSRRSRIPAHNTWEKFPNIHVHRINFVKKYYLLIYNGIIYFLYHPKFKWFFILCVRFCMSLRLQSCPDIRLCLDGSISAGGGGVVVPAAAAVVAVAVPPPAHLLVLSLPTPLVLLLLAFELLDLVVIPNRITRLLVQSGAIVSKTSCSPHRGLVMPRNHASLSPKASQTSSNFWPPVQE